MTFQIGVFHQRFYGDVKFSALKEPFHSNGQCGKGGLRSPSAGCIIALAPALLILIVVHTKIVQL